MTESTGFPPPGGVPDPEANRAQYAADHPDAGPVTQEQASGQVAAQLGAAAPAPGVSGDELGQQMADAGASAGLPYEDAMNALMDQVRAMSGQIQALQERDRQREQAQIQALGEPILQRYANGVRDKLQAHAAANPGAGDHFRQVIADAGKLVDAASSAIARGANDLGTVQSWAARIERFFTSGHRRNAQGPVASVDLSAAASDLAEVQDEADRLQGDTPPAAAQAHVLTAG